MILINKDSDTQVIQNNVQMLNVKAIHVFAEPTLMTLILRQNDENITITSNDEDIQFNYHASNISITGTSTRQNIGLRLLSNGNYIRGIQTFEFEHYCDNVSPEIKISIVPLEFVEEVKSENDESENDKLAFSKHEVILKE